MDSSIEENLFLSKNGKLESKAEAKIVTKESTDIILYHENKRPRSNELLGLLAILIIYIKSF